MIKTLPRLRSIDAFRAVTMWLMIFVNDIEDIPNTPQWIHHVADDAEGMGLADVIFPVFLFIVGLSIPAAFKNRSDKSYNIPLHILKRSAILIFFGFLFTNLETYNQEETVIQQGTWQYLAIFSMFFMFTDYSFLKHTWLKYILQGTGVALLAFLLVVYKSNDPEHPWLHFTWWGILGLIGWAYLFCALIFYFSGGKLWVQIIAWLLFVLYNLFANWGFIDFMYPLYPSVWLAGNGAMQAFTMAGIITAVFYSYALNTERISIYSIMLVCAAVLIAAFGFIVRESTGGISKAFETPAWVALSTSACMLCYLIFVWSIDIKKGYRWVKPIEAAGVATLMCFLLPDIFYSWFETTGLDYPDLLKDGIGGLVRGVVFAFLSVWVTALLLKIRVRLKL